MHQKVQAVFGDASSEAFAIIKKESGWNPNALHVNTNGSIDYGLFQINSVHIKKVGGNLNSLLDPDVNIKVAYEIYKAQCWRPWGDSTACK